MTEPSGRVAWINFNGSHKRLAWIRSNLPAHSWLQQPQWQLRFARFSAVTRKSLHICAIVVIARTHAPLPTPTHTHTHTHTHPPTHTHNDLHAGAPRQVAFFRLPELLHTTEYRFRMAPRCCWSSGLEVRSSFFAWGGRRRPVQKGWVLADSLCTSWQLCSSTQAQGSEFDWRCGIISFLLNPGLNPHACLRPDSLIRHFGKRHRSDCLVPKQA